MGYSNCASTNTYYNQSAQTGILADHANLSPVAPFNSTDPTQPIGPELISDINFNWGSTSRPLNGASPVNFDNTFVARWTRSVTLSPGTYSFSTVSDDGVSLWIDDVSSTNLSANRPGGGGYIINDWTDHAPRLTYTTFTVSSAISRVLTLEYYENGGGAVMILNATRSNYSFTDSPNTPYTACSPDDAVTCINGLTVVQSVTPGNSSLMLNGFFDLSGAGTPSLSYQRLYQLAANNFFYVEVSTDGGFNWATLTGENLSNTTRLPPGNYWDTRNIDLSSYKQPNVMIRFRLDTRTSGGTTRDGVYIANIRVAMS
ncbi:MAG: PA14 domain-containing protein [Anaerolineae bacterium]